MIEKTYRRLDSLREASSTEQLGIQTAVRRNTRRRLSSLREASSTERLGIQTAVRRNTRRLDSLRYIAPVVFLLLFAFNQTSSAQRAKQPPKTRTYTIDLSQSQVTAILAQEGFIARKYQNHRVEVRTFSGKIEVSPKDETQVAVEVEAEAKSLTNVDQAMSEFERKEFHSVLNNTVIETDKFPKIKFVSAAISDARKSGETRSFTLAGDLTLHGVTKRVSFPVNVTMNDEQLRATGEAKLKHSDFGMKPYSAGLGMIKIGDEVKINFEVVAKPQ